MHRRLLLLGPALLAACASPEPLYFTLQPSPGTPVRGGPALVEMRRIGLAGYLDRPEIVRNNADYRLAIGARERWGEPLAELAARVLADNLNQRLPGSSVFTAAGSISAEPDAVVELDMQRFDADAQGAVVLLAQIAVLRRGPAGGPRSGGRASSTRTVRLNQAPAGPDTTALVAAMSAALGQLADAVAGMLRGA